LGGKPTTTDGESMPSEALLARARKQFHANLLANNIITHLEGGNPSNADGSSGASILFATGILDRLEGEVGQVRLKPQTGGRQFENQVAVFLRSVLEILSDRLWGDFAVEIQAKISDFAQYRHLRVLEELAEEYERVKIALGGDYLVNSDVVIARSRLSEEALNLPNRLVDERTALRSTLRAAEALVLHASISCKLTIRSDRSQNSRLEALNLIRNRRGRTPHIVVVSAEPLPSRLSSIAVGTGDFDCIYHVALPELQAAVDQACESGEGIAGQTLRSRREQKGKLDLMVAAGRLKDIGDLPLDLLL
jgi:hypothetical protein